MEGVLKKEYIDYQCPSCLSNKAVSKGIEIISLPKVLILTLSRFVSNSQERRKNTNEITFPKTDVNFGRFVSNTTSSADISVFDLVAFSYHAGSIEKGHYFSLCRSSKKDGWFLCNDSRVVKENESDLNEFGKTAYFFFFRAKIVSSWLQNSYFHEFVKLFISVILLW